MHPFLTCRLEFGMRHPPWEDIWEQASRRRPLDHYHGRVHDGATGKTYRNARAFLDNFDDDDNGPLALPFAVNVDGTPDYDYALEFPDVTPSSARE